MTNATTSASTTPAMKCCGLANQSSSMPHILARPSLRAVWWRSQGGSTPARLGLVAAREMGEDAFAEWVRSGWSGLDAA